LSAVAAGSPGSIRRSCSRSHAAAPPHSAAIAIAVPPADTTAISYNSCRNRHCPRCLANARLHWLQAREQELLPTRYVHLVFTLPHEFSALILQNKRVVYNLLFQASAATLLEIARDPRHLGAEIGFFSVLHTWGQNLEQNPHS
jgi:Transposase zinc-binding domain